VEPKRGLTGGRPVDLGEGARRALLAAAFWLTLSLLASLLPAPGEGLGLSLPPLTELLTADLAIYAVISFLSGALRETPLSPILSAAAGAYFAAFALRAPGRVAAAIPGGAVEVDFTPMRDILAVWILLDSLLWSLNPLQRFLTRAGSR